MPSLSEPIFLDHLADRLNWSLLAAPSTIQVLDMDSNNSPQWYPLFPSKSHHDALAALPITSPPRSRMLVVLNQVEYAEYFQDSGDEPPTSPVIENLDGQPISVAQFVSEVHEYTLGLRNVIHELEDRADDEKAVFLFSRVSGPKRQDAGDTNARFVVDMHSNVVRDDELLEAMCANRIRRFVELQRG
jgi:hypothetical protein